MVGVVWPAAPRKKRNRSLINGLASAQDKGDIYIPPTFWIARPYYPLMYERSIATITSKEFSRYGKRSYKSNRYSIRIRLGNMGTDKQADDYYKK